jgi:hypothetical protein
MFDFEHVLLKVRHWLSHRNALPKQHIEVEPPFSGGCDKHPASHGMPDYRNLLVFVFTLMSDLSSHWPSTFCDHQLPMDSTHIYIYDFTFRYHDGHSFCNMRFKMVACHQCLQAAVHSDDLSSLSGIEEKEQLKLIKLKIFNERFLNCAKYYLVQFGYDYMRIYLILE